MVNIDRHIAFQGGWIAGPAFGVAMMAAPEYLHLGPALSAALFWGGIAVFLATAGVVAFVFLHEERKRKAVTGPIIVMTLGAITFCGGAAWYFWPSKTENSAEASALDGSIQIACDHAQYPTVLPQQRMFELQLNNQFTVEGSAMLSWSFPAGAPLVRDPSVAPIAGGRLRISNYGKTAIINARFTFSIFFRAIEKVENGIRSGEVTKSTTATTNPLSIGPGEFIDIYAMNYSTDAFADMVIPETAQGFEPGRDKQETFKLIPPVRNGIGILPFVPKFPPAPTQPNKQGTK